MSLKQGIILWVSGSLTALFIVGVFWTIFRTELTAARLLVRKAEQTFERAEDTMSKIMEAAQNLQSVSQGVDGANQALKTIAMRLDGLSHRVQNVDLATQELKTITMRLDGLSHRIQEVDVTVKQLETIALRLDGLQYQLRAHTTELNNLSMWVGSAMLNRLSADPDASSADSERQVTVDFAKHRRAMERLLDETTPPQRSAQETEEP